MQECRQIHFPIFGSASERDGHSGKKGPKNVFASATPQEIDRGEEPDGSPVEPIAKKQKKEKTQVTVKVKEPGHEERD